MKSLENYLAGASGLHEEILMGFDPIEVEQLYNRIREIGYPGYVSFVEEHLRDILQYISLTPSQRRGKKWTKYADNLLLRLAAYQISYSTGEFLQDIGPIAYPVNWSSYRDFHALFAGALSVHLTNTPFALFPFDDYDDPFPYYMKV